MSKHTKGPWMIETSNSWRRIGTGFGSGDVCCPVVQKDGHPDLFFRNGGSDGPDAALIAAAPRMHDYIAQKAAEGDAEAAQILEAINGHS